MKAKKRKLAQQALCGMLAVSMVCVSDMGAIVAMAKEPSAKHDETLYVTLDEYGNATETSVVKGYTLNGTRELTDFGTYSTVNNMTNYASPVIENGKVTFQFDENVDRFFFEGQMDPNTTNLPWTIDITYKLNGVEKRAEELAGASGLIELDIHLEPNQNAPEYMKNNMILQAASIFDMKKTLSVEAPGAQVQTLGDKKAVLFMAMPGEEQDFVMRIGSDSFEFTGMMFLMVPVTLGQIEQVADLHDAVDEIKESMDKASDSLDIVLNSLGGMKDGLANTSNGLRSLELAHQTFDQQKNGVYTDIDASLASLNAIAQDMKPMTGHLSTAQQALEDANLELNYMNTAVQELNPILYDLQENINDIDNDIDDLRHLSESMENNEEDWLDFLDDLQKDLDRMYNNQLKLEALEKKLSNQIQDSWNSASEKADEIKGEVGGIIETIKGTIASYSNAQKKLEKEIDEELGITETVYATRDDIEKKLQELGFSKEQIQQSGLAEALEALKIKKDQLKQMSLTDILKLIGMTDEQIQEIAQKKEQLDTYLENLGSLENTQVPAEVAVILKQVKELLGKVEQAPKPGSGIHQLYYEMSGIRDDLEDGIYDIRQGRETLEDLSLLFKRTGNSLTAAADSAQAVIDSTNSLVQLVNRYHSDAKKAVSDSEKLVGDLASGTASMAGMLQKLENQAKSSGKSLNPGITDSLNGLADSLDEMADGLAETDTIQDAKDTIKNLLDEKWDKYTGEESNILNMDANADPISFTSLENGTPDSVQVVMRSKEITIDDDDDKMNVDEDFHADGSIFHRIGNIFKNLWNTVLSIFKRS